MATDQGAGATLLRGALAGLAGTVAMDTLWYRRKHAPGTGFLGYELSRNVHDYEHGGAPAQLGLLVLRRVLGHDPPAATAGPVTTAVHALTGAGWGIAATAAARASRLPDPLVGLATGFVAWAASYALLTPLGVYEPIWRYPPRVLWEDLSAHLVFGAGTGLAGATLGTRRGG